MTSAGLNSLRQKEYLISVRNWIFDDPFHKKGLVLVIWVLGIIKPSGSIIFFDEMRLSRSLRLCPLPQSSALWILDLLLHKKSWEGETEKEQKLNLLKVVQLVLKPIVFWGLTCVKAGLASWLGVGLVRELWSWTCLRAGLVQKLQAGSVQKLYGWKCLAAGSVQKFRAACLRTDLVPGWKSWS